MIWPIPEDMSAGVIMFLRLKNITISSRVPGEQVRRDSSYGLEILCEYLLEGKTRAMNWILQKAEKEREFCKNWRHEPRAKISKANGVKQHVL